MLNKGHFANFKIVLFSMPTVQLLTSKTLVSLIRISLNFHTMYRNDCRLTSRNCDFQIPFPNARWQMNDDRQIMAQFAITGPILIKFAQYVEKISPLNIFESKLWYSNPFRNASVLNKGHFTNFAQNRLPWQCPLRNWKKRSGSRKFMQIPFIW